VVSIVNDMITIHDSGGVGDHIAWKIVATDASGNTAQKQCEIEVLNPGQGTP
jgi:hypothetical protein